MEAGLKRKRLGQKNLLRGHCNNKSLKLGKVVRLKEELTRKLEYAQQFFLHVTFKGAHPKISRPSEEHQNFRRHFRLETVLKEYIQNNFN